MVGEKDAVGADAVSYKHQTTRGCQSKRGDAWYLAFELRSWQVTTARALWFSISTRDYRSDCKGNYLMDRTMGNGVIKG